MSTQKSSSIKSKIKIKARAVTDDDMDRYEDRNTKVKVRWSRDTWRGRVDKKRVVIEISHNGYQWDVTHLMTHKLHLLIAVLLPKLALWQLEHIEHLIDMDKKRRATIR